jgi:hypothetical protein
MGRPVCVWFLRGEEGRHGLVCGDRALPGFSYCALHKARSMAPPDDAEVQETAALPRAAGVAA